MVGVIGYTARHAIPSLILGQTVGPPMHGRKCDTKSVHRVFRSTNQTGACLPPMPQMCI